MDGVHLRNKYLTEKWMCSSLCLWVGKIGMDRETGKTMGSRKQRVQKKPRDMNIVRTN